MMGPTSAWVTLPSHAHPGHGCTSEEGFLRVVCHRDLLRFVPTTRRGPFASAGLGTAPAGVVLAGAEDAAASGVRLLVDPTDHRLHRPGCLRRVRVRLGLR